ncbi:prephenate dehydratase [Vibrio sp. RC27]
MNKIATLGPSGTFSEIATHRYLATQSQSNYEINYYPSIKAVFNAIGDECDIGVLPIENFSEGFIPVVLDELIASSLTIVAEIVLPIHFSVVSQAKSVDEIQRLFVQFVAKGQCSEFLDGLTNASVTLTESNTESLQRCEDLGDAAIVPSHTVEPADFNFSIDNVNDYQENQTRFLVLSRNGDNSVTQTLASTFKTSIIVLEGNDYPGLLGDVLNEFSLRSINLSSIISRPTRKEFGKYHFFIDFDGSLQDNNVSEALTTINALNPVQVLGSYQKWVIDEESLSEKQ